MKSKSLNQLLIISALIIVPAFAKRPPREKPAKEPRPALTQEQKQIIAANIAQVMGGVCTIVQDPHNPHNIGNSVATMVHGLINIIVEKFARKNTPLAWPTTKSLNTFCDDLSKEITEIIITQNLLS